MSTLCIVGGRVIDPSQSIDHIADLWVADGKVLDPRQAKQRANAMAAFLAAGGDHDAGTVPQQPVAPKSTGQQNTPAAPIAQAANPKGKSPR